MFLLLSLALSLLTARCAATTEEFNVVTDCGAKGDGRSDDTAALQTCLDEAGKVQGSVEVVFPAGYVFLTKPLTLSASNASILMDGTLQFMSKSAIGKSVPAQLFLIENGNVGFSLSGGGVIDGNGTEWWTDPSEQRPFLVIINNCANVVVQDISLTNSPMFHLVLENVRGAEIFQVSIFAPAGTPNTDGIDPSNSQDIHIFNCHISNGDDCVAVKGGCSNVLVENCYFENGHGASVGSLEKSESVQNITFRNIQLVSTMYGARIKAYTTSTGIAQNVTWYNLTMSNVDTCIVITQFYTLLSDDEPNYRDDRACLFTSLLLEDISGSGCNNIGQLECISEGSCANITFDNVNLSGKHGYQCSNITVKAIDSSPTPCGS